MVKSVIHLLNKPGQVMMSSPNQKKFHQTIESIVVAAAVIVAITVVYLLGGEDDVAHDTPVPVHGVACVRLLDQYNL